MSLRRATAGFSLLALAGCAGTQAPSQALVLESCRLPSYADSVACINEKLRAHYGEDRQFEPVVSVIGAAGRAVAEHCDRGSLSPAEARRLLSEFGNRLFEGASPQESYDELVRRLPAHGGRVIPTAFSGNPR